MKILIADDEVLHQKIIKAILDDYGDCDIVTNGKEAVNYFVAARYKQEPYDLVCLDIHMPEMEGLEALQKIKETEQVAGVKPEDQVKVLMATSSDSTHDLFDAFKYLKSSEYLLKPIREEQLVPLLTSFGFSRKTDA